MQAFYAKLGQRANMALAGLGSLSFVIYIFLGRLSVAGQSALIKETLNHFFAMLAGLFLLLVFAIISVKAANQNKRNARISLLIIAIGAVLFRGALVGQSPWLSNDIYRYLWDAQLVDQGVNPYMFPPAADELANWRDATIYPKVDHKHVHSVYPPFLQILFWTGRKASQTLGLQSFASLKLIFVLVDLGLVLLLFRLLAQVNIDPRWAMLYAWHPLPIIEIAGSGHTDGVGALTLVLAIASLVQRRYALAAIFLALGFLVKFITVIFLPFLFVAAWKNLSFKKAWWIVALFALLAAGSYAPFAAAGEKLVSGLMVYSEKWRFNDGIFSLVFSSIHRLLPDRLVVFLMIPADWEINAVTLATRRIDLALIIAKIIVGSFFMLIYFQFLWRELKSEALRHADSSWLAIVITILAAFLLLSPTLQPWYLLWILPLLCLKDAMPGFEYCKKMIFPLWLLSGTVFLSYWVLANYIQFGLWQEPQWVKWVEYGIPLVIWLRSSVL